MLLDRFSGLLDTSTQVSSFVAAPSAAVMDGLLYSIIDTLFSKLDPSGYDLCGDGLFYAGFFATGHI
jgi:hypothetical protein